MQKKKVSLKQSWTRGLLVAIAAIFLFVAQACSSAVDARIPPQSSPVAIPETTTPPDLQITKESATPATAESPLLTNPRLEPAAENAIEDATEASTDVDVPHEAVEMIESVVESAIPPEETVEILVEEEAVPTEAIENALEESEPTL